MIVLVASLIAPAAAAPVQVHVTGSSQADPMLIRDILQHMTYYGAAFGCAAPSDVSVSVVDPAKIPDTADYRAPSNQALYEEWDANFCGKTQSFFVSFWPDPAGGSFLSVRYPYPPGAPKGRS